jgi:hypothetical protein
MAIVVEEENAGKGGWGGLLVWSVIFVVLAVAIYYVFFKRPDLVEVHTPANFENTVQLSKINLNPDRVVNDPLFISFKKYAEPLNPIPSARPNPFFGSF